MQICAVWYEDGLVFFFGFVVYKPNTTSTCEYVDVHLQFIFFVGVAATFYFGCVLSDSFIIIICS